MSFLELSDSPWTQAYFRTVQTFRNDPFLGSVISPSGWRTFTGEECTAAPLSSDALPSFEVLPFGMRASSEAPVSQYSPFGIAITIATSGTDVRDLMNLWGVVHNSVFPGDGSRVLITRIREDFVASASGAQIESITLGLPAITPSPPDLANQILTASGNLILMIRVRK